MFEAGAFYVALVLFWRVVTSGHSVVHRSRWLLAGIFGAARWDLHRVKILGRWASDAIEMYLRVHAGQCAEALDGMAGASEKDNWYKFGGFAHELLREPLE